jgi:hypothetical protein
MICAALLALAAGVITTAEAASVCEAASFESLTLPNIEILQFDVTIVNNISAPSSGGAPVGSPSSTRDIESKPRKLVARAANSDMCQIAIKYTHPGQNDVVNTWVGLPLDAADWNSRFQMAGGGGWVAGSVTTINTPVVDGYSSSSTDGGHNATTSTADWGLVSPGNTNWPALWDFASVALGEAAKLGQLATEIYFGSKPTYSYWNGCSTGGRQGHAMAQKYPELFDGIVAGSSAINWEKFQLQQYWSDYLSTLLGK